MNAIPKLPSLVVTVDQTPPVVNRIIMLHVGFFYTDSSLTDVTTSATITLVYPLDGSVTQLSNNTFITNQVISFGVTAYYTHIDPNTHIVTDYYTTFNLQVVTPQDAPSQQAMYNLLKQEEPPGVYTQDTSVNSLTYLDNWVTAGLMSDAASSILQNFKNVYPELADDVSDWYVELFGNDLISPAYPNALIQQMNNLALIPSACSYIVTSNISEFIYNLLDYYIPVSINDLTINEYDYWILGVAGHSELGDTTYLAPIHGNTDDSIGEIYILNDGIVAFTDEEKSLINTFIGNLIRPTKQYVIIYDKTLIDEGFDVYLGNTYYGDLRLTDTKTQGYAIVYNTTAFYKFRGYSGTVTPDHINSLRVSPVSGSTISSTAPTTITITGVFSSSLEDDVTLLCKIVKDDDNVLIAWHSILPIVPSSTTTFNIMYGAQTLPVTYTLT